MIRSNGNISVGRVPDALLTELKGSQICGRFSDKRTNAVPPICSFVSSEVSRELYYRLQPVYDNESIIIRVTVFSRSRIAKAGSFNMESGSYWYLL